VRNKARLGSGKGKGALFNLRVNMRSSETKDGSLFEIHEGPEEETDL